MQRGARCNARAEGWIASATQKRLDRRRSQERLDRQHSQERLDRQALRRRGRAEYLDAVC